MAKLRNFSLSDLEKVREIDRISFPKRRPYSEHFLKNLFQRFPEGFIVAAEGSEIVGYTIGRPKNNSAEILSLAVAPGWREKGIGQALTSRLIECLQKSNAKEVFLYVRPENKVAVSFYQKLGFEIVETIKHFYRNGDDAYSMKKGA
ncbi:MAG: ribosomal-protein-alanine N-acetyltransferase [Parcubacteria group bacterium CG1_02_39_15]|uniref:[Ribosomal protein bS18]-alanine N-acetyltransferase n=3 Tax=Candidatus Nealsoniibacteriota TaxID=1817911 RepID=A0A2H0MPH2_9BACT|nr:MAG: ribosomal-protein-alanine N-acetyltransferase [Parcubacteria group bacterium CG1_02_39_15]PIQ98578.1 MAG: ribosomal-protein-alanine N-acetyltransferase [Candidatus Nealsonbacteria bacterium CG11_big_fil_rev_8_21_14_0_20_39_9]PIW90668.1 MAG: ribosomal-protein-alanine N-acetyltransferase [Candidatus Nealsonbacteria bacterium CG_4_8_14_3_um_filter_40_11]PIZ88140.1 MAG: ribosomal-protein-alanine N-acetyltransferase [Candidatus Nealsonbacteria bacterium CG_4_10_14_0_2_um_filter_39_15]